MSTDTQRLVSGQDPELEDLAELLHRAGGHAVFPAAKVVACTVCIEQARSLTPKMAERDAAARKRGHQDVLRPLKKLINTGSLYGSVPCDDLDELVDRFE